MSIDDADTRRKNILRLVRKSAATDCDSESLQRPEDYPEHRIQFLEYRKQFEQPPSPVDEKPPFLPHWISSEDNTELSITYKKKGAEITDLRINYVDKNEGINDNETDSVLPASQKKFNKTTATSETNRIVDTPRKNQNILSNCSISRPRPIVRKVIELKKYDHIVKNVISKKK